MTREEASDIINNYFFYTVLPRCNGKVVNKRKLEEAMKMAIEALKQPERIKAKWIDARDYCGEFLCSNCHNTNINKVYHYCPYCGAELEVEQ